MSHRTGGRIFNVKALTRVEGEGALRVQVEGNRVVDAQLNIYEPPRFFEAFLRGRSYLEPPDITARICGICPVAYQMTACRAIEDVCGVTVPESINSLRRLLYCGEWIESHVLHIYMLHAPDFLGVNGAIELASTHRDIVERGLRMKKVGNRILEVIGGRAIHPINVRVGGFHRAPTRAELTSLVPDLEWGRQAAIETIRLVSGFDFPEYEGEWDLVAISDGDRYPIMGNRISSVSGLLDISVDQFGDHLSEVHVPHSTALQGHWEHGEYLVGPLARFSLNYDLLPEIARNAAEECGLARDCRNPFRSIIVRSIESLVAYDEA
ncbi:MAG: nickel-dependent hydrogenase large subunit, partial [Candidatus Nanopelagicales bacterium]|nr:nickel-dependent hydrogenase large subunit [Candidatus Nanopelagicales bacterium]